MDLFIETLTGTAFEMTVSPFDTVMSIKSKIHRVEGIPVAHQHLLYNTVELEDASCLIDYSIEDGATLKLVLSMRGGPISTRRLPVGKEIAWKEHLRELVEGRQDDERDRLPPGARVTVFVFGEGSQMNLVRVIENDDGSYTPLSESWSGSSIRNLFAEEDPEQSNRRLQENSVTMGKMQDLQHKMETLTMQRKPKNSSLDDTSPPRRLLRGRVAPRPQNSMSKDSTQLFDLRNKPNLQLPQLASCDTLPSPCLNSPHLLQNKYTLLDGRRKDNRQSRREFKGGPNDRRPGRGGSLLVDVESKQSENLPNHFRDVKKPLIETEVLITSNVTVVDEKVPGPFPTEAVSLSHERVTANSGRRYRLSQFLMESEEKRPKTAESSAWRHQVPCSMETQLGFGLDPFGHKESATALEVAVRSPRYGRRSLGLPSVGTQCTQDNQEAYRPTMSDAKKSEEARLDPGEGTSGSDKAKTSDSEIIVKEGRKAASDRIRCAECKKRLNITNMYTCRCGQMFCAAHRHCEVHKCTFDYKSHGRRLIQDANPVISAPKLPKI